MFLVFCNSYDTAALWAFQELKARGLKPIELVTAEELAYSLHFDHRLSSSHDTTKISLFDGRVINSEATSGVLNRLQSIPKEHLKASTADQNYAVQEYFAFFISWLYSLPRPVLNPATPQGLSGQWRHASTWALMASLAGLSTPTYEQNSHDEKELTRSIGRLVPLGTPVKTVFMVNSQVVGLGLPSEVAEGCRRLAELANTPLLGIEFVTSPDGSWTFVGATPFPDLKIGGQQLLEKLSQALQNKSEGLR